MLTSDESDKQPGWKFSRCVNAGYSVRVEVGPKDIEKRTGDARTTRRC
ncbi:His/Gly/Thr/Pro-type tRNA ligase C-terminal domain-containing protein [Paenibacillus sp. JTLBN-2024]